MPSKMFDQTRFQYLGAIVRIKIRNFMTYTETEVRPGPNLNIILGPNGTGKSAIVCCIIVGLAGEVGLTGRGASVADFVKKRQDQASTEIELYNDSGKNFVIERIIKINHRGRIKVDHSSEWKINGAKVLKNDVKALTKKLNIKVDNLCQFLPQDSVTQFVKMNSSELLINTLKAAGDNQLVEDHQKLITYTRESQAKRFQLQELVRSRQENEVNAKRLEAEVTQLRQRETLIKEKKVCSQKIAYVKYLDSLAQLEGFKASRDKMIEDHRKAEMSTEPCKQAIKEREELEKKARATARVSGEKVMRAKTAVEGLKEELNSAKQNCQAKFADFKKKLEQESKRAGDINLRRQEISTLECKQEEYRDIDVSGQLKKLEEDMAKLREARKKNLYDKTETDRELRKIIVEMDKLKREEDQIHRIKDKKLQLLQSRNRDAIIGLDWLNKNRHLFKKQVYPPMMCEIDVKDPGNACIVENAIPRAELMSFVCQTKEDLQTFTRAARDELKIRLSVVLAPTKTMEQFNSESQLSPEYLKSIKVSALLKDLITCPEPILRYLCANHNFHRIPIAKEDDGAQFRELRDKFRKFYIGLEFYHVTTSRYDAQQVIGSERVREAQLLNFSLDTLALKRCQLAYSEMGKHHDELMKKQEQIADEDTKLRDECTKVHEMIKEFSIKDDEKRRVETQLQRSRELLKTLESERIDIEAERAKLAESMKVINSHTISVLNKIMKAYGDHIVARSAHMRTVVTSKLAVRNHRLARKRLSRAQRELVKLNEELRKADGRLKVFNSAKDEYKNLAEDKVPGFRNGKLDKRTRDKFNTIQENTVPLLKDRFDDLEVRISRIYHDANNSILREYTRQNEQLQDKTAQIAELTAEMKTLDTVQQEIKRNWVPKLQKVIEVIDKNYRDFMQKLSYGGQVKLDFDQAEPDNFSAYGISILVKYRDNDILIPLSATRQSGGERSVATMIYMLALQTKTTVPFRCVDEINQGMDKDNERKVFELLIHTADSSSSQYFLVSPKLLNNLPYSDKMMVHVVFNGKNLVRGAWDNK